MTINETGMTTIPTKRLWGFRLSSWTIGLLLLGAAGIVAALMVARVTSGTEPAVKTATASLSVDGVEQSRTLNVPATSPKAAITALRLDGILAARALNGSGVVTLKTRWLQGLATGLILPGDVTTRLQQHPGFAKTVMAEWRASQSPGHGVLDARTLNKSEPPTNSFTKKGVVEARLTGIADARALN
jgi:hypothetical protein